MQKRAGFSPFRARRALTKLWPILSLILASCMPVASGPELYELDECYFSRELRTGRSIKWRRDNFPISVYIHTSVSDEAYLNTVAAADLWNLRWEEFSNDRGIPYTPIFEIAGRGEKFTAQGSLLRDDYNMVFFASRGELSKVTGSISTDANQIQAVTYSQKQRGYMKSADVVVNSTDFIYHYGKDFNQYIVSWKAEREPLRRLASSHAPNMFRLFKLRLKRFFKAFFELFRPKKEERRPARYDTKSIPRGKVDFPSLIIHEFGHAAALGHVDEKESIRSAARHGHSIYRGLASKEEDKGKDRSVMKVELPEGVMRRHISDYDLNNLFCGYYEKAE